MSANVPAFSQENPCFRSCQGQINCKPRSSAKTFSRRISTLLQYCSAIQMENGGAHLKIQSENNSAAVRVAFLALTSSRPHGRDALRTVWQLLRDRVWQERCIGPKPRMR